MYPREFNLGAAAALSPRWAFSSHAMLSPRAMEVDQQRLDTSTDFDSVAC